MAPVESVGGGVWDSKLRYYVMIHAWEICPREGWICANAAAPWSRSVCKELMTWDTHKDMI